MVELRVSSLFPSSRSQLWYIYLSITRRTLVPCLSGVVNNTEEVRRVLSVPTPAPTHSHSPPSFYSETFGIRRSRLVTPLPDFFPTDMRFPTGTSFPPSSWFEPLGTRPVFLSSSTPARPTLGEGSGDPRGVRWTSHLDSPPPLWSPFVPSVHLGVGGGYVRTSRGVRTKTNE